MSEQSNELPIDMSHKVISEQTEKQMTAMLTKKPKRVRKFNSDWIVECTRLEMENHALKCRNEQLTKDLTRAQKLNDAVLQDTSDQLDKQRKENWNIITFAACITLALGLLIGIFGKAAVK
jgi:glyceraldehyde-3-phosphate dehydrogenase/erythrose-4-phosphate dehydrogenase